MLLSDWPSEVDNDQLKGSSKLILLKLHEKLLKTSTLTILYSFGIWSQLERWKSLISGYLMRWPQIKIPSLWSVFFYFMQQWTTSWLDCDVRWKMDFIWQPVMTHSLSDWTEKKLQSTSWSQPCTQERWWSLFGCLSDHYSFLNPGRTITSEKYAQPVNEMQWKLARAGHDWAAEPNCTENCNACNWHRSTEWAQFSSTAPDHTSHNQHFRSWTNWAIKILPHLPYSPDLLPTDYHFLKHLDNFLQGKCFHNQQEAENAF